MSELAEWGLVGFRGGIYPNIGGEVARQIAEPAVAERLGLQPRPLFIATSTGLKAPDGESPSRFENLEEIDFPDVTFLALPSTNDGELANEFIKKFLDRGKIVVTAEKGAIANHFESLRDQSENFRRLGITATVGGGTRMMEVAKPYCADVGNISQIHLVLNGTLSAIMSLVGPRGGASGISIGQAVDQAVRLGYAEPGSESPHDVIKSEAEGDIPKKVAILYNALGLGEELIDWHELGFDLKNEELLRVIKEAGNRRFIVSLFSAKLHGHVEYDKEDIIGGFRVDHGGWQIVGGFQHVDRNPLLSDLGRMTGPANGAVIGLGPDEKHGVVAITGPGAGVSPTVKTMLDDYYRLRELR